jgi:hypothetical protein
MIRYVRESFFSGCQCVDLDDLNRQVAIWCATVTNARIHATAGEVPAIRLAREPLLPLTGRPPYATTLVVPRRLTSAVWSRMRAICTRCLTSTADAKCTSASARRKPS